MAVKASHAENVSIKLGALKSGADRRIFAQVAKDSIRHRISGI